MAPVEMTLTPLPYIMCSVSFLLRDHRGEPMHRPLLENVFPFCCILISRLNMPLANMLDCFFFLSFFFE